MTAKATALAFVLTLVCTAAAQTNQSGAIGLLPLPELSGVMACEPPTPPTAQQVPVYARPQSKAIVGWIRAVRSPHADDGCPYVALNVHWVGNGKVAELSTAEFEYEWAHAAVVLEARRRWFKLRLNDGAGWIEASHPHRYLPLEALIATHPAGLTEAWDGRLAATPGGVGRRPPTDSRRHVIGYVEPVFELLTVVAEAFAQPDRSSPVVEVLRTDSVGRSLRMTSSKVAVFARRPGWSQVALQRDDWKNEPRVWIEDGPVWRFHALASSERDAFQDDLFGREHSDVQFLAARSIGGKLWLRVAVMSHRSDDSDEPSTVVATGWVPAHDGTGEPVVWFYTRD